MKTSKICSTLDRILNFMFYGLVARAIDVVLHKSDRTPFIIQDSRYHSYVIIPKDKYDTITEHRDVSNGVKTPTPDKN